MPRGDGGSVNTVAEAQVKRVSYAEAVGPIRRVGHLAASDGDPSGALAA